MEGGEGGEVVLTKKKHEWLERQRNREREEWGRVHKKLKMDNWEGTMAKRVAILSALTHADFSHLYQID